MARDCPNQEAGGRRMGGADTYKRPRRDDDGGYSRAADNADNAGGGGGWGNAASQADWNSGQGATSGWGA